MKHEENAWGCIDTFTLAYIEAALWSTSLPPYGECPVCDKIAVLDRWDEEQVHVCNECSSRESNYEPPADSNYSILDLAPETLEKFKEDCAKFQAENEIWENSDGQAGHDFWLTRNGHGSGYWDGDWPITGDTLTEASKAYGEVYLYVGDDGMIYCG